MTRKTRKSSKDSSNSLPVAVAAGIALLSVVAVIFLTLKSLFVPFPRRSQPADQAQVPPAGRPSFLPTITTGRTPRSGDKFFASSRWGYNVSYPPDWQISHQEDLPGYGTVSFVSPDYTADNLVGHQTGGLLVTIYSYHKKADAPNAIQWASEWVTTVYSDEYRVPPIGTAIVTASGNHAVIFDIVPEPPGESVKAVWGVATHQGTALILVCAWPRPSDRRADCVDSLTSFLRNTAVYPR